MMPGDLDRRYHELKRLRKVVADLELRLSSRHRQEMEDEASVERRQSDLETKKPEK
jgi:hypothetical protein